MEVEGQGVHASLLGSPPPKSKPTCERTGEVDSCSWSASPSLQLRAEMDVFVVCVHGAHQREGGKSHKVDGCSFLVNKDPLVEKEELLLEIERKEKKAPEKKKRTWKDVLQEQTKKYEKIQ